MIRVLLGLALLAVAPLLEAQGAVSDAWGAWFRPGLWIAFVAAGLACIGYGIRALRHEAREERATAAPARKLRLSAVSRSLVRACALATLVVLCLYTQTEAEIERADWPPKEEILHLPQKEALRLLSLGYREFVADLVWLRAIAYFGEHLHGDRNYRWLDRYLDTILHLDPRFRTVYRWAGTVTMYNLRLITREAVLASNRYLEQGYRQFPDTWEFPFMICANYLFELPRFSRDLAEKRRFQEIGAQYCREASLLPGPIPFLPTMAGGVLSRLGKRQLAARHFRELILRTEDPKARKQIEERYAALASGEAARRAEEEAAEFFRAHKASYPYVSPDLFLLLGRRGEIPDPIRGLFAGQ